MKTRLATTLRLTPMLDRRLRERAKAIGVSKNAYILMILNNAV